MSVAFSSSPTVNRPHPPRRRALQPASPQTPLYSNGSRRLSTPLAAPAALTKHIAPAVPAARTHFRLIRGTRCPPCLHSPPAADTTARRDARHARPTPDTRGPDTLAVLSSMMITLRRRTSARDGTISCRLLAIQILPPELTTESRSQVELSAVVGNVAHSST
jgi:hypothetical protein